MIHLFLQVRERSTRSRQRLVTARQQDEDKDFCLLWLKCATRFMSTHSRLCKVPCRIQPAGLPAAVWSVVFQPKHIYSRPHKTLHVAGKQYPQRYFLCLRVYSRLAGLEHGRLDVKISVLIGFVATRRHSLACTRDTFHYKKQSATNFGLVSDLVSAA